MILIEKNPVQNIYNIMEAAFSDNPDPDVYAVVPEDLRQVLSTGGSIIAVFDNQKNELASYTEIADPNPIEESTMNAGGRKLQLLIDAITETVEPSDKLGYNWRVVRLADMVISKEYIPDDAASGTADNPFVWVTGVELIPNAYYTYMGVRYVYMGVPKVAGENDIPDDSNFSEWAEF